MCRLKAIFEIGKGLYVSSCGLPRRCLNRMLGSEIPDSASEKAFGAAHEEEREMRDVVPDARGDATHLLNQERFEIDMRQYEFDALDVMIKARAVCSEETHAPTLFIDGEGEEPPKKNECCENEEKIPHGLADGEARKAAYLGALAELLRRFV